MRIDFYLRYSTKYGQQLFITGDALTPDSSNDAGAVPMQYFNTEFWHASIELQKGKDLQYCYLLKNEKGEWIPEGEKDRHITARQLTQQQVVCIDTWNYSGAVQNAFYTAPFKELLKEKSTWYKGKKPKHTTHIFKVKSPLLQKDEVVCLSGNSLALHEWSTDKPVILEKHGYWFSIALDLTGSTQHVAYKYGIYNLKHKSFVQFESGSNRLLNKETDKHTLTILHDGFVQVDRRWRGSGVAVPVFSLRTADSFGVGEFADLKLFADWASATGLKMIQLLPVNDTSASFTAQDSYPYAAISAFALHPVYINLQKVAGKKHAAAIRSLQKKGKQLNALADIDYDQVIHYKMSTLRELYDLQGDDFLKDKEYIHFFEGNKHWLKDYAAFCYLRDKWGTADFKTWKSNATYNALEIDRLISGKTKAAREIQFYFFIQYHLHIQLKDAVAHAHKKGVVLKGDIPIGIYRNSVDAWVAPELYHMCWQAGAPPDDFAVKGQNWGFPTYNWEQMANNGFEWWKARFEQMSTYFDAFRIDHILGFFRIWSIPMHAVEGIMGRFVPALPITLDELKDRGISFDHDRYCKPYISAEVLHQIFGDDAAFIKEHFLVANGSNGFDLKEEFNTQRKVEDYFNAQTNEEVASHLREGLFDLISNVIFFKEQDKEALHFRISVENTTSFQHLEDHMKAQLKDLYINYFYRRQDDFWEAESLRKLPYLKEATEMLVCGEDLGMVPHCVPGVMKDMGILSLEIQRMPKNPQTEFFHPKDAPYLSVITPSTHDMSTIRGWWEEDRAKTQRFYNSILEGQGEAPWFCESWINRAIVLQHLYAPAMWAIFSIQDLLGMNDTLRRENPLEERINQPADPKHYWRYRMHIDIEQLLKEKVFNEELKDYITNSGR